ncbi:MAG: hypothetical protein IKB89_04590, partial [Clostridia bacterium]|nr:hypothetical protein [Clostridia bacterium]
MKRFICLMLALIMVFAVFNVSAAETMEIAQNGGFEESGDIFWDNGNRAGCGISDKEVYEGKYAYEITQAAADDARQVIVRKFDGFVGATYTYSMQVKRTEAGLEDSYMEIWMSFKDGSGAVHGQKEVVIDKFPESEEWQKVTVSEVAPKGTQLVYMYIFTYKGGTYYFDNASMQVSGSDEIMQEYKDQLALEERLERESLESLKKQEAVVEATVHADGAPNLMVNPGFEEGDGAAATGWDGYMKEWGTVTTRTDEEARSGNYSMKVDTRGHERARYSPYVGQNIYLESGFIPGQKYVFTAWLKLKQHERDRGVFLKIEPYSERYNALNTMLDHTESSFYNFDDIDPNGNDWHQIKCVIEVAQETKMMTFLLRIKGEGLVYYDDVSFGLADGGSRFDLYSTRTFCYTEDVLGTAVADINTSFYPIEEGSYVDFALKDGETVLESARVPAADETIWNFTIGKMAEQLKAYTLEASYKDAAGNPIGETLTKRVYRTNRPTCLDENGNFYDENGEIFYPILGYGNADDFWQDSEIHSINVFKTMVEGHDWDDWEKGIAMYKQMLDDGQKEGIKFFLQLGSSEPNGYPGLRNELAEHILKNVANHPAVFAWIVIDEVSLKINNTNNIKTYDYMEYWLEQSYIQIRKYDTMHPIYLLDTGRRGYMERSSRVTDIFATDPYPTAEDKVPGYSYIRARWSTLGNHEQVPVAMIVQMTPFKDSWRPSITAVRHQFYQGFWGGAKMLGFFSMTGASDMTLESIKDDPDRYKQWCDFNLSGEKNIAFKHFSEEKTTLIANWQENDVWYRIWQDPDDKQNYLLVMNMNPAEYTADIKLVSNNGKISFDGYTAELVNGAGLEATVTSQDNTFKLAMPSLGVG